MKTLLLTCLLLFTVPLFVHAEQASLNNRYERIEWQQTLSLPTRDAAPHPGVAGAFSGFIGDYLVIAGGANFPNGMPWENGEKSGTKAYTLFNLKVPEVRGQYPNIFCPFL